MQPASNRLRFGQGLPAHEAFLEAERQGWIGGATLVDSHGRQFRLYNYTKRAQFHRKWNEVTTIARGLIVCLETGEIAALPLVKFFNLGERLEDGSVIMPLSGSFDTLVKKDGSLGISFRFNEHIRWTSRGSFLSQHGTIAQEIWDRKYRQHESLLFEEYEHLTLLAEIIHPFTRVVCRYPYEDLILIAARDRFTGRDIAYDELAVIAERLGMPITERIDGTDVDTIISVAKTLDDNHEGFVLVWPNGFRVKVKGEQYKELHRVLSGITPRQLAFGWWDRSLEELLTVMPEEFRDETEELIDKLDGQVIELAQEVERVYLLAPQTNDQVTFADWVRKNAPRAVKGFIFARHDLASIDAPDWIAGVTLCTLIETGKLSIMLESEGNLQLARAVSDFEHNIGEFLWNKTRSPEGIAQLNKLINHLPAGCEGVLAAAIEGFQPTLVVRRVQEYLKANSATYGDLNAEAIFAAAPPPDSPYYRHLKWVMTLPLPLRSFLDRWRESGRRETAAHRAQLLLSAAFNQSQVERLLAVFAEAFSESPASHHAELITGLPLLRSALANLWCSLPQTGEPQLKLQMAKSLGVYKPRALALLFQSWHHLRTRVRDNYLAAANELRFASRFDDA